MTQKDFELIARVLNDQRGHATAAELWRLTRTAEQFADELSTTNPRFKRDVFLRACGVES
jgi:hypothetical protein